MITYKNCYGISLEKRREKYDVIVESVLDPMIETIVGEGTDLKTADLSKGAESFLKTGGMSEDAIKSLKAALGE